MASSRLDRVEQLTALRARGALTEEEFEAEKRALLAGRDAPRWPLFAGIGAVAVAAMASTGVWMGRTTVEPSVRATPTPVASASPSPSPTPVAMDPAERLAAAFDAATGHRRTFTRDEDGQSVTTRPLRILDLPFGPVLLVERAIKDGCHACAGAIGTYYLREADGRIAVAKAFPEAVPGSGWGAAPEWELTERFTASPALYATGGYSGQGTTESSATITELTAAGPITSAIPLGYDNEGGVTEETADQTCTWEGRIADVIRDRSFDVVLTGSITGRDHYAKRNGKFMATEKAERSSACGG